MLHDDSNQLSHSFGSAIQYNTRYATVMCCQRFMDVFLVAFLLLVITSGEPLQLKQTTTSSPSPEVYRNVRISSSTTRNQQATVTNKASMMMDAFDNSTESRRPYLGDFFYAVYRAYSPLHGYVSLVGCILGIVANACNIIVLTRYA